MVHTANLIHVDWNNKSQGLWMQDFPWKDDDDDGKDAPKSCGFEDDLVDYLTVLKWPEFTASLPGRGNVKINASFFRKFDYSNATVLSISLFKICLHTYCILRYAKKFSGSTNWISPWVPHWFEHEKMGTHETKDDSSRMHF